MKVNPVSHMVDSRVDTVLHQWADWKEKNQQGVELGKDNDLISSGCSHQCKSHSRANPRMLFPLTAAKQEHSVRKTLGRHFYRSSLGGEEEGALEWETGM